MVGLGNPGRRYRDTRHNAGATSALVLAERSTVKGRSSFDLGDLALLELEGRNFLLLLPSTFMNDSGRAVVPVTEHYHLEAGQVLVLHDDIDIPLGEVRVKKGGGTAGHRGLESLTSMTGGGEFYRVRIGVGRPPDGVDAADYVLSRFGGDERAAVEAAFSAAAEEAARLIKGEDGSA